MVDLSSKRLTEVLQWAKDSPTREYNCWGSTLYMLGIVHELQWENDTAVMYRHINPMELVSGDIEPGDVIVIDKEVNDGRELIHTGVCVYGGDKDSAMFLHKRGQNTSELATEQQVRDTYPDGEVSYRRPPSNINKIEIEL